MKKHIALFILAAGITWTAAAQENGLTLSGGYAFANMEGTDINATGWRVNLSFEANPNGGKFYHGVSIGYVSTQATEAAPLNQTNTYKVTSWPVYYAPKFVFGGGSLKGFVKGAIGMQFSKLSKTGGAISVEATDSGFYGGLAVGGRKEFGEKWFMSLEYEWAYASNNYYRDGFINTINLGVGMRF